MKYIDYLTGEEFGTKEELEASERKSADIRAAFAFVEFEDDLGPFGEGEYCVQRSKEYYEKYRQTLIEMVKKYEPLFVANMAKHGHPLEETLPPGGLLGIYLSDILSPLNVYHFAWSCICPTCYREWGNPYCANHCKHEDKPKREEA